MRSRLFAFVVLVALLPFLTGATIVIRGPRVPAAAGGAPYTDTLSYSNGTYLGDATDWVNLNADSIQVNSGKISPTVAANRAVRHTGTLNEAHYAELDIDISTHAATGIGVIARASDSVESYYYANLYNDVIYLGCWSSGSQVSQTNTAALSLTTSATTIIRIEASGTGASTRLTVKTNTAGGGWVTQISAWDPGTYLSNGFAGAVGFGTATNYEGNEFRSGNL